MTAYAFLFVYITGGPQSGTKNAQNQGMTLTDWFAGQIIAAMLGSDPSNSKHSERRRISGTGHMGNVIWFLRSALDMGRAPQNWVILRE
jgi:hypothetical protein